MAAPHDPVENDTEAAPGAFTVDPGLNFFVPERIIADTRDVDDERYLVKWDGYPLHECTWEPPENLANTDLLLNWEQIKQELSETMFQRMNDKNFEAFEKAQSRAEANRERESARRKKKCSQLQPQAREVDCEEEPLTLASIQGEDGLFIAEERLPVSGTPAGRSTNARSSPSPRKAPLQQSSSEAESNSDAQDFEASRVGELRKKKKEKPMTEREEARDGLGTSILQKKATTTTSETTSKHPPAAHKGPQRVKVSAVTTKYAFPSVAEKDRAGVTTATTMKPTDRAVSKPDVLAIRTSPPKQTSRAINFVDQPKDQRRGVWSTDHHYSKLKFRALAEKRSRTEGTPDFNALSFPNGPPPSLPKAAPRSNGDPYGRREITTRRVQEEDPDDRPRLGQHAGPLADWETEKVPLMCNAWKLSSNCPYGAKRCRFMHRSHDPQGRPYKLGDINNSVPQKYRKPPITCEFWYNGDRCHKSAEECLFAHEDTGWSEISGKPIEREHLPPALANPDLIPYKLQNPPITCHFWLRDPLGCSKTETACKYAHWNSGWAPPENNCKGPAVAIDPSLGPCGATPKYADSPLTCTEWLRSETGCSKSDQECKYAHLNTGWAPSGLFGNGGPSPIDPGLRPRSQTKRIIEQDLPTVIDSVPSGPRGRDRKGLTCPAWLRAPHGCPKLGDACEFSHQNTGWATPKDRPLAPPVPLDPNQIPRFHRDRMGGRLEPKYRVPPLTCPAWLKGEYGCHKKPSECEFAHENTGWTTGQGDQTGQLPPVEIKKTSKASIHQNIDHTAPKNGQPPVTCFFWLEGARGCSKSKTKCRFAHSNTGWLIRLGQGQNLKPEQIDPKKKPKFRTYEPTEVSETQNSHVEPTARRGPLSSAIVPCTDSADHTLARDSQEVVQSPVAIESASVGRLQAITTSAQLNRKIENLFSLDITDMFLSGVPGDDRSLDRRAMLLYSPEEHAEEVELITRWLLMHDVQVSNLWYEGAWNQFQEDISEGKSGIIIAHPGFDQYVELSGFHNVLKQRTRIWSVGLQPPPDYELGVSPDTPDLHHNRVGIFPHGGLIYITDDVFDHKPQLALRIVKSFFAKIERLRSLDGPVSPWLEVYDACLLWRLCVRPELMESLFYKCEENAAELAGRNPDFLSRAELYQLLTSTNYIEQDHPAEPLSLIQDKYPILSERREVAEHPPVDYFHRLANSQEDANTHMIGYYAALQSADMRRAYRYFYVVHTEPEAACVTKWRGSLHNIADVITPERCIEEFRKPSKESLFDFLDWAMEPKDKEAELDSGEAPMEISVH